MENSENNLLKDIYSLLYAENPKNLSDLIAERKKKLNVTSHSQLANATGISKDTLRRIIIGDVEKVDIVSIIKISNFLGIGVDTLVKIYISTLNPDAIKEIEKSRKASYILNNFDLTVLKKAGFIEDKNDFEGIEKRIVSFFELKSIFEYESEIDTVLFSRTKSAWNDRMLRFWVKSAYLQFKKISNPYDFDLIEFEAIIPKIRAYTQLEEKGLLTVIKALYSIGITVIIQSYLETTQIRGGTMLVDGKPCIILTNYNNRYDTLWFALMHELAHVRYDMDDLERNVYHLTGHTDVFLLNEERANYFARELLFAEEKLEYAKNYIENDMFIRQYAKENSVHPAIIYGFFIYDNPSFNVKLRNRIPKSEKAIKLIKTHPWPKLEPLTKETIKIKKLIES